MFDHIPPPFNPDFRPGFKDAVQSAYEAYCKLPDTPKGSGPCETRAAAYGAICNRLAPQFPTVKEGT